MHDGYPPKPPDPNIDPITNSKTNEKFSFRDKLLVSDPMHFNPSAHVHAMSLEKDYEEIILLDSSSPTYRSDDSTIQLSSEEMMGIYNPSKFSIIIKLMGKRILHQYLKRKIQELWKPTEQFPLIDLGEDYYIVKFSKEENMVRALHQGP